MEQFIYKPYILGKLPRKVNNTLKIEKIIGIKHNTHMNNIIAQITILCSYYK